MAVGDRARKEREKGDPQFLEEKRKKRLRLPSWRSTCASFVRNKKSRGRPSREESWRRMQVPNLNTAYLDKVRNMAEDALGNDYCENM